MIPSGVVVVNGRDGDLIWEVAVDGEASMMDTMLRVWRSGVCVLSSGFSGPGLYPGADINQWRGREQDTPHFVMARTRLEVARVRARTDRGLDVELVTNAASVTHGLRFHATALPDGHAPASLSIYVVGVGWKEVVTPIPSH